MQFTRGKREIREIFCLENTMDEDHLGDISRDERIILICTPWKIWKLGGP
jgi:hypothetical protein